MHRIRESREADTGSRQSAKVSRRTARRSPTSSPTTTSSPSQWAHRTRQPTPPPPCAIQFPRSSKSSIPLTPNLWNAPPIPRALRKEGIKLSGCPILSAYCAERVGYDITVFARNQEPLKNCTALAQSRIQAAHRVPPPSPACSASTALRRACTLQLRQHQRQPAARIRRQSQMPLRSLPAHLPVRMNRPIRRLIVKSNPTQPLIEHRMQHNRMEARVQRRRIHARSVAI